MSKVDNRFAVVLLTKALGSLADLIGQLLSNSQRNTGATFILR